MINESKALLFNFDSPKMILSLADTSETLVLGEHEEDVLNEVSSIILFAPFNYPKKIIQITLSSNKKTLAYTTDAGTVGVVDLSTKKPFNMKVKHANVSLSNPLTTDVDNPTDFLGCEIHPRPTE